MSENLRFEPAVNRPDLLPSSINELLKNWRGSTPVQEILVTPIDAEYADSANFCEHYGVDPKDGANCVIAVAVRGENRTVVACLIPVNCRADLNNVARRTLGAKRVSFAPLNEVLEETAWNTGNYAARLPEVIRF